MAGTSFAAIKTGHRNRGDKVQILLMFLSESIASSVTLRFSCGSGSLI
jgi:hypothetical protein